MKRLSILFSMAIMATCATAQSVKLLTSGTKTSIRGLSVVNDSVIWVSGSAGMVGRSTNGGTAFTWTKVIGFEKTDFRDIEAFDANTAIIMAIDSPAFILKTTNGGNSWKTVYRNDTHGMFLDAMDFYNDKYGITIGDPINGKFFLAETKDGGETWVNVEANDLPVAENGEACFASSGTNIRMLRKNKAIFISGGKASHLFVDGKIKALPILQGAETTGANSIALKDKRTMMVVGGDFNTKDSAVKNCFITHNGGKTWIAPQIAPHGYRSCIEYIGGDSWITCGLSGVDITANNGETFTLISKDAYHVCRKAKKGTTVFFAGGNGKIGMLVL